MDKEKMRKLKSNIYIVSILVCIVYIVFPIAMGWYATWCHPVAVGDAPNGFDNVTITTSDGIQLAAWYTPAKNEVVIILLHGSTDSRNGIRDYAEMLTDNGFGVLAFDLRGHGESEGDGNAFGWNGTLDVGAALAFLKTQPGVTSIGGLGVSLGGEVLMGAASTYPELKAIISDGGTSRSIADFLVLPSRRNLLRSWTTRLTYAAVGFFSGDTPPVKLLDAIANTDAQFLLIAAGDIKKEIDYNTCFQDAANGRAALWVASNVGHTGAFKRYPEEYEEHVISFFKVSLLGGEQELSHEN